MSQIYVFPPGFASASPNGSVGPNGNAIPSESTLIGGESPTNTLLPIQVDALGNLIVSPLTTSSVVKAQLQDNNGDPIVLGQNLMANSLPVVLASDQSTVPTSNAILDISVGPTGNTPPANAIQIGVIDQGGNLVGISNGQALADASLPVVIASDQNDLPMNLTQVGSAAFNLGQELMADSLPVVIASNQSTLPVSAASLPLPTGAATEAEQLLGNASLSSIDSKLGTLGQKNMAGSAPVVIASDQSTLPISAASLPLPTGAATEATLSAMSAKLPATLGQKTSANSLAVVIASDQSPVETIAGGKSAVDFAYNAYGSTPVTTGAYVELIASVAADASEIEIFDSSGQAIYLAFGAAASEVDQVIIIPGGNGRIPLAIPAGTRISLKALTANATVGYIAVNLYGA